VDENSTSARISQGHTYKWKNATVAGVASFWGDEDEFVICTDLKSTSRRLEQIYMKSLTVVLELAKFIYGI